MADPDVLATPAPVTSSPSLSALDEQATFDTHLRSLDGAPEWLIERKKAAWARFLELPMPSRRDENWRFGNTGDLSLTHYGIAERPADKLDVSTLQTASEDIQRNNGKLVFADNALVHAGAVPAELTEQGVIFMSLRQAIATHPELLEEHLFNKHPELGSEKMQALHDALAADGSFLFVPKNVEVKDPFVAYHWSGIAGSAIMPYTLVIAEDNARVSLVEVYENDPADTGSKHFVNAAADIVAGPGAKVFHKAIQNWNDRTLAFHLNTATAHRDADVRTVAINVGSRHLRHEHHTFIEGQGANIDTYALNVATGEQEFDQRTLQTHAAASSRSDILYKNALFDEGHTIFSGLIKVEEDAQQTDAYQTNRNLVLSDDAQADSLPGLEILANDVKCSHGATTGRLDDDILFYFQARGIPARDAQQLMVYGFFEEILAKLDNEELHALALRFIDGKFGR